MFHPFRFRAAEWGVAVTKYTEALAGALEIEERSSILPSLYRNRSSAHFAAKDHGSSLCDAKTSLRLEPRSVKGNFRAGRALYGLSKFQEATRYFGASLAHAKRNARAVKAKELKDIENWQAKAKKVRGLLRVLKRRPLS